MKGKNMSELCPINVVKNRMEFLTVNLIIDALNDLNIWTGVNWSKFTVATLVAIMRQESDGVHTEQQPSGPARSYWQFEDGEKKALNDVLTNAWTRDIAPIVIQKYYECNCPDVFQYIRRIHIRIRGHHDFLYDQFLQPNRQNLACMFARLNLMMNVNDISEITMKNTPLQEYRIRNQPSKTFNVLNQAWEIYKDRWKFNGHNAMILKVGDKHNDKVLTAQSLGTLRDSYVTKKRRWETETWPWTVEIMHRQSVIDKLDKFNKA
jgi:hypothetical protein